MIELGIPKFTRTAKAILRCLSRCRAISCPEGQEERPIML